MVVGSLANVTGGSADSTRSQLPRDLNTINGITAKTVDILLNNTNSVNISQVSYMYIFGRAYIYYLYAFVHKHYINRLDPDPRCSADKP